jgi:hypothetical protein
MRLRCGGLWTQLTSSGSPHIAEKAHCFFAAQKVEDGPSRQAAFFGPTVANGALRTLLDLQLAPAQFAVGTVVTDRPPHRTARAEFPHAAPTLGV